jgi:type II secretory ATPase GspE/PulE/Tfp pilus assembly ATPase PilB-like protein
MSIQELAEQCYKEYTSYFDGRGNITTTIFDKEKFAELVAAHEREECIQNVLQQHEGFGTEHQGVEYVKQRIVEAIRARSKA